MPKLSLEFLGTGTSVGVPVIGCDCAVCRSADPRNKRLRSSVLVRGYDEQGACATTVLIDTTPDFRQQVLRANVRRLDAVLISHYHADHVVGIDDIRRFNSMQNAVIDCWGTPATHASLTRSFGYVFVQNDVPRPGLPNLRQRVIEIGQPFKIGCIDFEPLELDHEVIKNVGLRMSVRGSRILSYCMDVKRISEESYVRLAGTDTLILDMLREKIHPTHMNLDESMAAVQRIKPRRTFFAHMAHEVDHQTVEEKLPEFVRLAYDGLIVELD